MPSGEEIQASLRAFVGRWAEYAGSERGEAQTFLNELFACYGTDRRDVGAKFEDFVTSAGFLDLHWPGICIVEMKAPVRPVSDAQPQLERYWRESSKPDEGIGAARWVVLCNFRQIEIWEPGRFILQSVWCMFADDLHMLEDFPFQQTLNAAAADPDNSAALIGYLFTVLNQKTNTNRTGRLAGTRYVNGELFAEPAYVQLSRDWSGCSPSATGRSSRTVGPTTRSGPSATGRRITTWPVGSARKTSPRCARRHASTT